MKNDFKIKTAQELEFLQESNVIEGVYDGRSLVQAIYAWNYLKEQEVLSEAVIKETHKILMLYHLLGFDRGNWRKVGVTIAGHEGMFYTGIPMAMKNWCKKVNVASTEDLIQKDHVAYEKIHPFVDGNGRTGRMFMNWQRLRNGLSILVIKGSDRFGNKQELMKYYAWFQ